MEDLHRPTNSLGSSWVEAIVQMKQAGVRIA
jgi:hypothetical protein